MAINRWANAVTASQAQVAALQGSVDVMQRHIDALQATLSWRVTAPLRAVTKLVKRS